MKQINNTEIHMSNCNGETKIVMYGKAGNIVKLISRAICKLSETVNIDPTEICNDVKEMVTEIKEKEKFINELKDDDTTASQAIDRFFEILKIKKAQERAQNENRKKGLFTDDD